MVQGERCAYNTHFGDERDRDSKRAGFESMQKRGPSSASAAKTSTAQFGTSNSTNKSSTSYGSFGPIFKNQDHFKSLHFA